MWGELILKNIRLGRGRVMRMSELKDLEVVKQKLSGPERRHVVFVCQRLV